MVKQTTRSETQRKRKQDEMARNYGKVPIQQKKSKEPPLRQSGKHIKESEEVGKNEYEEKPEPLLEAPIATVAIHTAKRGSKKWSKRSNQDEDTKEIPEESDATSSSTNSLGSKGGKDEVKPGKEAIANNDNEILKHNDEEERQSNSQANSKKNELVPSTHVEAEDNVKERKAINAYEDGPKDDQYVNDTTPEVKGPNIKGSAKIRDHSTADGSGEVEEVYATAALITVKEANKKNNLEPNEHEKSSDLMVAAFLLYCVENKSRVIEDFPAKEFNGIAKVLTEEFRALPEPEITCWCNAAIVRDTDLESWMDPFDCQKTLSSQNPTAFADSQAKNVENSKNEAKVAGTTKTVQSIGPAESIENAAMARTTLKSSKQDHRKKRKDPNVPKKFGGPYMLYSSHVYDVVKAENPGISFSEVGCVIGGMYRSLSAKERAYWQQKAEEDKARYGREMSEFLRRKKEEVVEHTVN